MALLTLPGWQVMYLSSRYWYLKGKLAKRGCQHSFVGTHELRIIYSNLSHMPAHATFRLGTYADIAHCFGDAI